MQMNSILIIDDEATIRILLSKILELEGYEVLKAKDRASGLEMLKNHNVQVVLCDVFLPDGNGIKMIPELKAISPKSKIILLTAHGNIPDGVQAIKDGAFDYITKGDDNQRIIPLVSRAMDEVNAEANAESKRTNTRHCTEASFDSIIGKSTCLTDAINMARKVARTDVCVLLTGETGTGKEVFAHAIHCESPRKDKPFVAINCSAFSKELLESELFGHKAGSFTGALKDKKGLFEEANGGTLFLDEIGEMEYCLQAKLLRALESKEFIKVGDTKSTKVDVRIIAATNRDLKKQIDNNLFREDLYFRLSVFQIQLPPLRIRKGDIRRIAEHFIHQLAPKMGQEDVQMEEETLRLMESYAWPGNVRELKNVIERALIVSDHTLTPDSLPIEIRFNDSTSTDSDFDLATVEKNHIVKILEYTKGNKTETARLLKIGLATLYRKIEAYHILPK